MPNLVGIGLSQVPTNSMLGGMAYQDPEHASIKNLDLKNLSQINSEIADTAVDVFVYDTRKDSDGGAWRKRTQHTSWYNETLNTQYRGSRREFPAVAVIVADATTDKVTIYDGDDPDLPMWMVFSAADPRGILGWATTNYTRFKVAALNGILTSVSNDGGHLFKFVEDFVEIIYSSTNYPISSSRTIGGRNDPKVSSSGGGATRTYVAVTYAMNDVAMTVLPNAPIDIATGLPVPTIAVATGSGLSVITDSGSVFDDVTSAGISAGVESCAFSGTKIVCCRGGASGNKVYVQDASTIGADFTSERMYRVSQYGETNEVQHVCHNLADIDEVEGSDDNLILGAEEGIAIINENLNSPTNGLVVKIASDYNTGWMQGKVRGAFLSDTTVESLTANTNLASNVLNGGTNRLTSHTYDSGDTAWQMVDNASSANGYVSLDLRGLTIGQSYVVSMTWDNNATLDSGYEHRIAHLNGLAGENATNFTHWNKTNGSSDTLTGSFVAQSVDDETLVVYANAITLNISNFNIRAVDDEDRSVNNNGLAVYGTVTKSAVATGADLVAYSNFSTSNHLRQPPNSNMNIGTGDAYEMIWYKTTVTSGYLMLISYEGGANGTDDYGKPFNIRLETGNIVGYASHNGFSTYDTFSHPIDTADGLWHCAAWVKRGQVFELYIDGEFVGSDTGAVGSNALSDANTELVIGARKRGKVPGDSVEPFTNGSLALARIGKSAPFPEQIKKMYEDEKCLFHENAKATLYGSSDAVTALAFDDTTNLLHVGTSAGRSEFQGLRRINNTTTAVTTAISASNGFVAEQ